MVWSSTVDERYGGSLLSLPADTYAAPDNINSAFVLAEGQVGFGNLTDGYFTADQDVYSLGSLSIGYFTLDVDDFTWDYSSFDLGSVGTFALLNSYGVIEASSYTTYSDINFSVSSPSNYYVKITGPSFGEAQYSVEYTRTGNLQNTNSPAIFSNASINGNFEVGQTLTVNLTYFDANGVVSAIPTTFWYADRVLISHSIETNSHTLTASDAGKIISFSVAFYDDLGNFGPFGPSAVVAAANSSPTGSITITGTTKDGHILTADTSSLEDADGTGTFSYQWNRGGSAINGANSDAYQLSQDDIGSQITVEISYIDSAGTAESLTSDETQTIISSSNSVLNGVEFGLTGDNVIDSITNGYKWDLDSTRIVDWTISSGFNGEYWTSPYELIAKADLALSLFAYYADISFNYLGDFDTPIDAAANGSEINFSMDGSGLFFNNDSFWAIGHVPEPDTPERGDIFLNINSEANYLSSYEIGSAGFFLILHEIGHTLGLKHPHDHGSSGRPTFDELGWDEFDSDIMTIMSYEDDFDWNNTSWDPATPMFLDVLALQYLYGKREEVFAGDDIHTLSKHELYATLWDPSGNDSIDQTDASEGWIITLPDTVVSELVDTKVGSAYPAEELDLAAFTNLYWLMGDLEEVKGSSFSDKIYGNSLDNLIEGNGGDDTLAGGSGSDTFIYAKGDGNDTILDFNYNEDSISYQGFNEGEVAAITETYLDNGSKVLLLTDGAEITLNGDFAPPNPTTPTQTPGLDIAVAADYYHDAGTGYANVVVMTTDSTVDLSVAALNATLKFFDDNNGAEVVRNVGPISFDVGTGKATIDLTTNTEFLQ